MRIKSLILLSFLVLIPLSGFAQTSSETRFITRGESVEQALIKLINTTGIDLVYDPKLDLSQPVYVDITTSDPGLILNRILRNTCLDFIILSTGTYVLTERKEVLQQFGSFFGYVVDDETDEPIEYATIYLADAANSTATNKDGFFSISPLIHGEYPVIISSVGYAPRTERIVIDAESEGKIIRLSPKLFVGDPVVIEGNTTSLSYNKLAQGFDLTQANTFLSPSKSPIIKATSFFSGLTFNYAQNNLSIQGGNPSNYLLRIDEVPVYNASPIGTLITPFSPYAIDKISIQKAGHNAKYGGYLAGQINFSHDITNRSNTNSLVQADPNGLNLRTEIFPKDSNWKSAATFRTNQPVMDTPYGYQSTFDNWNRLDPLIQNFLMGNSNDIAHYQSAKNEIDINFLDGHFVAEHSPSMFSRTLISGYLGQQNFTSKLLSERSTLNSTQPAFVFSQENTASENYLAQVTHSRVLNARTDISGQFYISHSSFSNTYYMDGNDSLRLAGHSGEEAFDYYESTYNPSNELRDQNQITDITGFAEITRYLNARNKLLVGLEAKIINYSFRLNDLFYFPVDNDSEFGLITTYANNSWSVNNNLRLEYGLRATHSTSNNNIYLMPRLSVTYDTENTAIGYHTFNISGGIYRQFFKQYDVTNVGPSALVPYNRFLTPVDASISPPASYQVVFSWSVTASEQTNIFIESYYKWEPQSYDLNFNQLLAQPSELLEGYRNQSDFLNDTKLFSYGGALTVNHTFADPDINLKMIQQVNISKQKNAERFQNDWTHTPWSEPFSSSLFIEWKVNAKLSIVGNSTWTPVRYWAFNQSYYSFLATHNETSFGVFNLENPETQQLKDYFRTDLGVNYLIDLGRNTLITRVDLVNILNRKNEVSYSLNPMFDGNGGVEYERLIRTLPGFIPSLSVQLNF